MNYNSLKEDLTKGFGAITKIRHCKSLSDKIYEVTHFRVSESTLWRIFVEKESTYRPHEYTLDILASYLGFRDWRDYSDKKKEYKAKLPSNLQLLDLCLQDHHVGTVVKYLKSLPADYSYDYNETIQIASIIGNSLTEDKQLRSKLMPELASFEQGRMYFTDMYVDELNFDLYYKQNLHYYLKAPVKNAQKNINDQLFALNLLYKHALLKNDFSEVKK